MTKKQTKQRIEKLKKAINRHRYLYHVLDRQEISDAALDSLKHELYKLEQEYPEFIAPDSPTQRVGGEPLKEFKKVGHKTPMLSIEDVFSEKELRDWEKYIKRLEPSFKPEYFVEFKVDGFAITLIYKNGLFVKGATRGNGKVGEDVTQNLKTIESIPLKLEIQEKGLNPQLKLLVEKAKNLIKGEIIEIRGEVYMEKRAFGKLNAELSLKGEKTYANPRNLAAGSIRQLDPKFAASRPLRFLAYDIVTDMGQARHSEEHQILLALGFKAEKGKLCKNIPCIIDCWQEISKKRDSLPFQIDGLVISVNDNVIFQKLGVAGKSPRGIRAFKFSPKQATTKILDVKVQVGRTGAVTPIAELKPVEVGGVTITRATLHNEDEIKRLGVKIGDTAIVERAGDVIPAVAKVLPELRTGQEKNFQFPKTCPVCGTKLTRPKGQVVWRCLNRRCHARKREHLYYFTSKKAFDIEGLGPKIIDKLVDENLISQAVDIFRLKEGDLIPLERFAEKSAENLIKAIQKSKEIPLSRFINALGIFHIGEETALKLAYYFGGIKTLQKASKEEIDRIPDIGDKVASSVYGWFLSEKNQKFIKDLISAGIKILPPEKVGGKLKRKIFVLTGSLETLTREEAKDKIRLLGGEVSEFISKKTDFVVGGREPGSKLKKAKNLGVKIIGEKEFLEMLK